MTPEQLRVGGGGLETREKCDEERRERKRRRRRTNEPKVNARMDGWMDGCRGEKKEKKSALYRLSKRGEKLTGEDMAAADPDEFTIAN